MENEQEVKRKQIERNKSGLCGWKYEEVWALDLYERLHHTAEAEVV